MWQPYLLPFCDIYVNNYKNICVKKVQNLHKFALMYHAFVYSNMDNIPSIIHVVAIFFHFHTYLITPEILVL